MSHRTTIISFLLLLSIDAQSQQHIGQWKSFTDMKSVRNVVQVGSTIWATTSGGVFVFDTVTHTFTKFTNTDGLDTKDVNAIGYDGAHRIWIGGAGGWINIYDMNLRQWQTINDIAIKLAYPNREIQSFYFKGDTVFIAVEFGVSVFKLSRWEFGDTYSSLGSFLNPSISCMTLQQNRIWIGTDKGLATALRSSPSSWTNYTSSSGFPSNTITALAVFNDTLLIIGTNNGLAYFANGIFTTIGAFMGRTISDLRVDDRGRLMVLSNSGLTFTVHMLSSVIDIPELIATNTEVQVSSLVPASSLWIGTTKGLAKENSSGWEYFYPNGPNSDAFNSVVVDSAGVLWCGSGYNTQAGFYRYNPVIPDAFRWKNFTSDRYPIMQWSRDPSFGAYYHVSLGAQGSVWVSSWGDGFVKVVNDSIVLKIDYNPPASLPIPDISIPNMAVGGAAAIDGEGKTWMTVRTNFGDKSLLQLENDTNAIFFPKYFGGGNFHNLVIDKNDTKWIATAVPWYNEDKFLYYYNENKIPGTESTNGWGKLSMDQGLLSNQVLSLALGLDGEIWVGLGIGVLIIPDPLYPASHSISYPLYEQVVQAIAVDAVNNKWIGTKEGIFVVNADGTELLKTYSVANTNKQLLADDVRSIAIDQKRGIAYFGTEQGLSSLAIEPVQTNQSYSRLEVGPNPFILPSDQQLTIRNLVAGSTIKVMTVSGFVVTQFNAQGGGRAFWDGRDKNGAFVSSGIYFIIAFSENGSQTVTGKVAVIRR